MQKMLLNSYKMERLKGKKVKKAVLCGSCGVFVERKGKEAVHSKSQNRKVGEEKERRIKETTHTKSYRRCSRGGKRNRESKRINRGRVKDFQNQRAGREETISAASMKKSEGDRGKHDTRRTERGDRGERRVKQWGYKKIKGTKTDPVDKIRDLRSSKHD